MSSVRSLAPGVAGAMVALLVSTPALLAHEPLGSDLPSAMEFTPPAPGTYRLNAPIYCLD